MPKADTCTSDFIRRFYSKIQIRQNGCWEWTGARISSGYGNFCIRGRKTIGSHILSWELANGREAPPEMEIDHLCRNPKCVNPDHLESVTPRENNFRSNSWAGRNHRKTHCKQGHELTADNIYMEFTGRTNPARKCRKCRQRRMRSFRERLRRAA